MSMSLLETVLASMNTIPPEPLAEWMCKQGFDPKEGYILYLPESLSQSLNLSFLPDYVRVSAVVREPCFCLSPGYWPPYNVKDL